MKNYVKGNAWLVKTQFGELMNLKLNLDDLEKLNQQRGYVKLTLAPRKEKGKYGETHTIYENDYQAEEKSTQVEKKKR